MTPGPGGVPAMYRASLTRISLSTGFVRVMIGHSEGWTWWPSAISSTYASSSVSAATARPGAWWATPDIALNRWVVVRPPAAYPARASSSVASEWPIDGTTPLAASQRIRSRLPAPSGPRS
ncbi:MAG: hypothetical protein A2V85_06535 [Chloroflexi bacterium RBG_16_72_14]|nr:MAG: hypothetical protein A2V85_06535 [Chloroflexi bacterium RBG_16_72_14]